ncbi:hypothetical protein [Massilia agri]|uniref:Uncharacterized protein n=1 Tax=Massilia agri TaxID=1886785 RepID=A0ABT2AF54_9BURK|nr:hypothetical protein [Massilia agri]MCS0594815.1 hypothetical protein [Massilia agri]
MAVLSLLCSVALVFTVWLILPIFILGPLGIYFGWKSFRQASTRLPTPSPGRRLLALTPMLLAIVTMVGMIAVVNVGYRA